MSQRRLPRVGYALAVALIVVVGATSGAAIRRSNDGPSHRAAAVAATPSPSVTPVPTVKPAPKPTPAPTPPPTVAPAVTMGPVATTTPVEPAAAVPAPPAATPKPTAKPTPRPTPTTPPDQKPNPRVLAYQKKLLDLGYWLPAVNGYTDEGTAHAVTAFQKVAELERNGILDDATKKAIEKKVRPSAQSTSARVAEVSLKKQVLMLVKDGKVLWILDISSGKASTATKTGKFHIYREVNGMRQSRLGRLWRPKYFWQGQAFHGYPSVPNYPASHGCVRLTNDAINWIWDKDALPIGLPVWIYS